MANGDVKSSNAQAQQQPPIPDPELKCLEPLIGTWKTTDRTQDSILGPGVTVESSETYDWLDGGYFLVSTWITVFGADPPQKGIMYWGYHAATRTFRTYFFDNQGPFNDAGNRYESVVVDGTLTFTGPARFLYELDADGKIRVNPDGTISVAWWLRDSEGDWRPWMHNTFTRIK